MDKKPVCLSVCLVRIVGPPPQGDMSPRRYWVLGCQVFTFGVLFAVSSVWMACCLVSSVCLVGGCNFLGLQFCVLADFGRESVSSVWLCLPLCWHLSLSGRVFRLPSCWRLFLALAWSSDLLKSLPASGLRLPQSFFLT